MLRVVIKNKGALLSKPNSFQSRSWRLNSVRSTDLLDGVGSSINIYFKGSEIIKVLPNRNLSLNDRWISDKVRYFYSSILVDSVDKIYFRKKSSFKKMSYEKALFALSDCLEVYTSEYGNSSVNFVSSCSLDLKAILEVDNFSRHLGCMNFLSKKSQKNIDLSSSYKFNFLFDNLEKTDLCLFVGSNIRYEASSINIRLRKVFRKGCLKVFSFGFFPSSTFSLKFLGLSPKALLDFAKGKSELSKSFKKAKNPVVIYGSSLVLRKDLRGLEKVFSKLPLFSSLKDENCVNFLSTNANFVGALNVGIESLSLKKIKDSKLLYLVGNCENLKSYLSGKKKSPFLVSQNSHVQFMSLLTILLPSKTFTQMSGYYQNSEGRVQKTNSVTSYKSKEDVIFTSLTKSFYGKASLSASGISNLSNILICPKLVVSSLPNKTFAESLLSNKYLGFFTGYLEKKSWLGIEKLYLTYFKYSIEDFYQVDFGKGSKILGELSKQRRKKATNYDFLGS